ncbi:MAG: LptA/OstA family protein [Panacagrimonas sp.]
MSRVEPALLFRALVLLGLGAFACTPALAQNADILKPTGPVTIEADHADWQKDGAMVYVGNVRLQSADLKLGGARLEFRQFPDGHFVARIDGAPATLNHIGLASEDGKPGPPIGARGQVMTYDSRAATVEVDGDAVLSRGTDEIEGGNVLYDVTNRRIQANGGEGGQVRIVIQPPPPKSGGATATPAPGSAPKP